MNIAVFYHTIVQGGDPKIDTDHALSIITEQSRLLADSGLFRAAERVVVGVNGDEFDRGLVGDLMPSGAVVIPFGTKAFGEFHTLVELWEHARKNPTDLICYFHTKGASMKNNRTWDGWRRCMGHAVITNWERCAAALRGRYDMAGAHWLTPQMNPAVWTPIWGGNFWWCRASYLAKLPSPMQTIQTRHDSEVWLTRTGLHPTVMDFAPHWPGPNCLRHA
jgi:hypothetical protein